MTLKSDVMRYLSKYNCMTPSAYNNVYKQLNCFLNWCLDQDIIDNNPIKLLKLKKRKESMKAIDIDSDIIKKLLSIIDLTTYNGLRNYTTIIVTMDTGIRPNELFNIKENNINYSNNEIVVSESISKTREQRILPISIQTRELLIKLNKVKPETWNNEYVFCTVDGEKMTSTAWSRIMKKYSNKIGYNIKPYDLRHTFAIMFLRNGGNVFVLQRIMRSRGFRNDKKVSCYISKGFKRTT
jgi:site-specific recombinase XerD